MQSSSSSQGFSLVETIIALGVLATGVIGAAGVLTMGMTNLNSSPADVVMTQKATQAIEAVFSARDSLKADLGADDQQRERRQQRRRRFHRRPAAAQGSRSGRPRQHG